MNDNKLQTKGFVVWSICALFFLYEFFLRTVVGTYQHSIMQDLKLTSFQFSLLSTTIFLLIYGGMQIPAGLIVNKIGLKKSLIIGTILCAISSIGFAYSSHHSIALMYRMMMGFGASFGFICLLVSVHEWMPYKYITVFIGLSQFIGTLGPMLATGPLEAFSHTSHVNWRYIFLLMGGLGFVLTILIFFFVENNRQKAGEFLIIYKPEKISNSIARLFSRKQSWYIAFLSASLYFTIEYLSENEGRAFLILKGIAPDNAGYMLTIAWIGYAVGCPVLGLLSDILERRKIILSFCSLLALISIIMIIYLSGEGYMQTAFLMLGISAAGQSIGFATIAEQFKKPFVAIAFGLNNAIVTTLSAINAPIIGLVLDHTNNNHSLSLQNYAYAFNILIITALLAVIISSFFIKETYCKSRADFTILQKPKKTQIQ